MDENVTVRPATVKDSTGMAELFMRVWHISMKDFVPADFLNQFQYDTRKQKYMERATDLVWLQFVAQLNGKIVGMIAVTDNQAEPLSYQKQIKGMYVDPDFQRCGIGSMLLEKTITELKSRKIGNVMLWCFKANKTAISFYTKHGGTKIENIKPPPEYDVAPHVAFAWKL